MSLRSKFSNRTTDKSQNSLSQQNAKLPPRFLQAQVSSQNRAVKPHNGYHQRTSIPSGSKSRNGTPAETFHASASGTANENQAPNRQNEYEYPDDEDATEQSSNEGNDDESVDLEESSQQYGSVFSKLLTEKRIDIINDYPKDNKIYQILSKDVIGSMFLLAYKKDLQAGLLESTIDELEVPVDTLRLDLDEETPAFSLASAAPSEPKANKKLKRYFNHDEVARFLVQHEVNRLKDRLPSDLLGKLAEHAAALFPRVGTKELWYQPSITVNRNSKPASGKLNRAMRELSKNAFNLGIFSGRSAYEDSDEDNRSTTFEELKLAEQIDPDVEQKWLSIHCELEDFFSKTEEIKEIFDTFPILKLHGGLKLLTDLLEHENDKFKNIFTKNWIIQAYLILSKGCQINSPEVEELMKVNGELTHTVQQATLALFVMALMMKPTKCVHAIADTATKALENQPSRSRRKKQKMIEIQTPTEGWTATTKEMQESFVRHIEVKQIGDMTEDDVKNAEQQQLNDFRKALVDLYGKYRLPLNAHIVAIGPVKSIKRTILFIGDEQVQFHGPSSVIRAVDACFKAMTVLEKSFPKAASAVWEYMQIYVYEIPVPGSLQITKQFHSSLTTKNVVSSKRARKERVA